MIEGVDCDVVAFACTRCGYRFSPDDPLPIVRTCPKGTNPPKKKLPQKAVADLSCVHRGKAIALVQCQDCLGTKLKLFECAERGQCTIAKRAQGIACCAECTQIKAPDDSGARIPPST
jgi:hypothetical protein